MKRIFSIIFLLNCFQSMGQITVSGSGDSWMDGTYSLIPSPVGGNATCTNPINSDAGTSVFYKDNSANTSGYHFQFRRVDGYWYIEGVNVQNSLVTSQRYRTKFKVYTNTPPCGATWEKYSENACYYGQDPYHVVQDVNSLIITGDCESCAVFTDENHPMVHNFPIIDNSTLPNITPTDGLRPGSTVFHCGLSQLITYDGTYWNTLKGKLLFEPSFQVLDLNTNIQFLINHPYPALVDHYEIQVSDNRGDWTTINSYPGTTTSVNVLSSAYPETIYHFRLITHYQNHAPQISCAHKLEKTYTGPDASTISPPNNCCAAAVSILEDYVPGTLMTFNVERFVPDASSNWHLRIKDQGGNIILDQTFTPTGNPHSIKLTTDLFEYNKLYVADAYNPFWAGSLDNDFFIKEPYKTCDF